MKLFFVIAAAAIISAPLITPASANADIRYGTCTLILGSKAAKPQPCKIDFFNSGAIHLIWNDGETSVFELHDSRLNTYLGKRNGLYIHQTREHGTGHFTYVENPRLRVTYERFN